jgi:flagellar motor component MotA
MLKNWLNKHFHDEEHAREALVKVGSTIGTLGVLGSLIGLALMRWGTFLH